MRGRIVFINPATSTGLIFGVDRERYRFRTAEWAEPGLPSRNMEVSFKTRGNDASALRPYSPGDPDAAEDVLPEIDPLAFLTGDDVFAPTGKSAELVAESPGSSRRGEAPLTETPAGSPRRDATDAFSDFAMEDGQASSTRMPIAEALRPEGVFSGQPQDDEADGDELPHERAHSWEDEPEKETDHDDFNLTARLMEQDRSPALTARGPGALPPANKILFSMDTPGALRKPQWRNYLIGIAAAIVLLLIGFIVTKVMH